MKINIYIIILRFKAAIAVAESPLVYEISTCLVREIVIKCFNIIPEDHTQLIS